MRKILGGLATVLLLAAFSASAGASSIGYITGGSDVGNLNANLSNYLTDRGDGSTTTAISTATFNTLSAGDLLSSYDAIIFPWLSPSSLTPDWNSVLLPYLQGGGGIVWEDPTNINKIAADAGFSQSLVSGSGSTVTVTASVPGLTDGLVNSLFVNNHMNFSGLSPDWTEWLNNGTTASIFAEFGLGRIVISGPDQCYHGDKFGGATGQNQYTACSNELNYVLTDVTPTPLPAAFPLFGTGLMIMGLLKWQRKRRIAVGAAV